jgi:hypothetical protein
MNMINLETERILSLAEAARMRPLGRDGRPTHPGTVRRWIKDGVRSVKLEGIRVGGSLFTSLEALQRFAERLTATEDKSSSTHVHTSPASPRRASERAERMLDRLGF